jgi:hypothetical protein
MKKRHVLLNGIIISYKDDIINKKLLYLIKNLERNKMFSKIIFKNNITLLVGYFG